MIALEKIFNLTECLELERITNRKFEYLQDTVIALAGGTPEHNQIIRNLIKKLEDRLLDKGCQLLSTDDKLYTPDCGQKGAFVYPDIHIYCQKPLKTKQLNDQNEAFTEPSIIIEVLSDSTRNKDKIEKFECYRKIQSLQKYILIESQKEEVIIRHRIGAMNFDEDVLLDINQMIDILGCSITIKEVYRNTDFDTQSI